MNERAVQVRRILDDIEVNSMLFPVNFTLLERGEHNDPVLFLRVEGGLPDKDTGMTEVQFGRKWYISPHATMSEIVLTAWLAFKTFMEHEMREWFLWQDKPIFNPHIDTHALAAISNITDARQHKFNDA